jgi:competence protein ComEA
MKDLSRRETIGFLVILALITALVGTNALRLSRYNAPPVILREPSPPAAAPQNQAASSSLADAATLPAPAPAELVVHVTGAVKKPGVYRLPSQARGVDALEKAGGVTAEANPDALNLAARLEDGSRLHIPTRKEAPEVGPEPIASLVERDKNASKTAAKPVSSSATEARPPKTEKLSRPGQGTVALNSAGAEELQRLPGIGPAMAERILTYRKEIGGFRTLDELMDVPGIGPKKFERMQPFLRLK